MVPTFDAIAASMCMFAFLPRCVLSIQLTFPAKDEPRSWYHASTLLVTHLTVTALYLAVAWTLLDVEVASLFSWEVSRLTAIVLVAGPVCATVYLAWWGVSQGQSYFASPRKTAPRQNHQAMLTTALLLLAGLLFSGWKMVMQEEPVAIAFVLLFGGLLCVLGFVLAESNARDFRGTYRSGKPPMQLEGLLEQCGAFALCAMSLVVSSVVLGLGFLFLMGVFPGVYLLQAALGLLFVCGLFSLVVLSCEGTGDGPITYPRSIPDEFNCQSEHTELSTRKCSFEWPSPSPITHHEPHSPFASPAPLTNQLEDQLGARHEHHTKWFGT